MKKIIIFICALLWGSQEVYGSLGAAYCDNPAETLEVLRTYVPQNWHSTRWYWWSPYSPTNWFYNGDIDKKIYGLKAQTKDILEDIATANARRKNIETVRAGNQGWLLSIANWWRYGRWFNPWSGNDAVRKMDPNAVTSTNPRQQILTNKLDYINKQIDAWTAAQENATAAFDDTWRNYHKLDRIYKEGPQSESDWLELEINAKRLDNIKRQLYRNAELEEDSEAKRAELDKFFQKHRDWDDQFNRIKWHFRWGTLNHWVKAMTIQAPTSFRNGLYALPGMRGDYWGLAIPAYIAGIYGAKWVLNKMKIPLKWRYIIPAAAVAITAYGADRGYCIQGTAKP